MNEEEKNEWLINPGKLFPRDLRIGFLCGNKDFIRATETYLGVLDESQFWEEGRMKKIQTERLRLLTSCIAERSFFWRNFFEKQGFDPVSAELGNFSRLMILKRDFLSDSRNKIHVEPLPEDNPLFSRTSSGTTGIPLKLIYSEREMIIGHIPTYFRHPVFEKRLLAGLFSRKPFVVLGRPGLRYVCEKDFFYGNFDDISLSDLDDRELRQKIYESIIGAAPAILVGFGSLIVRFAEWAHDDGVSLPLLAVRTSSEPVSLAQREMISQYLKAPLINMLSGNGISFLGFECPENPDYFHSFADSNILEVVGESGEALPEEEEGELVVTSLSYLLTPHIRFAHGDIGRLVSENCPCGRTLPLFEFHGRRGYEIVLPSGKKVGMIHLHNALMNWWGSSLKAKQIQVMQDKPDGIRILVVPKKDFHEGDEIEMRMAVIKLFEGEKMIVEVDRVNKIIPGRGHKPRFFIPLSEAKEIGIEKS